MTAARETDPVADVRLQLHASIPLQRQSIANSVGSATTVWNTDPERSRAFYEATYELGTAYGHAAFAVDDLAHTLEQLKAQASIREPST